MEPLSCCHGLAIRDSLCLLCQPWFTKRQNAAVAIERRSYKDKCNPHFINIEYLVYKSGLHPVLVLILIALEEFILAFFHMLKRGTKKK